MSPCIGSPRCSRSRVSHSIFVWAILFFPAVQAGEQEHPLGRSVRHVRLNAQAYDIGLVFFGLWCILIGYLIARSTFLPRTIGVLYALAGLGYLTILWQPLAKYLYSYNLALARPRRNLAVAVATGEGSERSKVERTSTLRNGFFPVLRRLVLGRPSQHSAVPQCQILKQKSLRKALTFFAVPM